MPKHPGRKGGTEVSLEEQIENVSSELKKRFLKPEALTDVHLPYALKLIDFLMGKPIPDKQGNDHQIKITKESTLQRFTQLEKFFESTDKHEPHELHEIDDILKAWKEEDEAENPGMIVRTVWGDSGYLPNTERTIYGAASAEIKSVFTDIDHL